MKIFEVLDPHQQLDEGGKSDAVRYNSEIGLLLSFCNADPARFDPNRPEKSIPATMLANPEQTYADIKKLVAPAYIPEMLNRWVEYGNSTVKPIVVNKLIELGEVVDQFNWAGGKNQNAETSADVEFVGSTVSGCSVKEKSGITLNNPSPKDLGLEVGGDAFLRYARNEYLSWKKGVFTQVLGLAQKNPGTKIGGKDTERYYVVYDPKTKQFTCSGKNQKVGTSQEIMADMEKNAYWQRAFGDWFVANFATQKGLMAPLVKSISKQFTRIIKQHLSQSGNAAKLVKFVKRPFFYVNPSHVYYVPSIDDVADLTLKDVKFAAPDGATMKFIAEIGMPDSQENAQVEIHIRYANGIWETSPTARVQSLKNAQFLSWQELA
jgi:hypothetical protein